MNISWADLDNGFCTEQLAKINKRLKTGDAFDQDMLRYVQRAFDLGRAYERERISKSLQRKVKIA